MKNKIRVYFTLRHAMTVIVFVVIFSAWYVFGFWDIFHPVTNKSSSNSYYAKREAISKLVIDPKTLYPVMRVIDGDTFTVKINEKEITVRVLGENAPETVKPKSPVECYGPEASAEDKSLLNDHSVYLEIDPTEDKVDFYGRLLAYVRLDDGLFLEEYMIKNGFAKEYTFDKKKPYEKQKEFISYQKTAQDEKKGLWEKCK